MKLKPITELIDPSTRIVRVMLGSKQFSGYVAFVNAGVLVQRRLHDMPYNALYDSCTYVSYRKVDYAVNIACKPISGVFNAESLKVLG